MEDGRRTTTDETLLAVARLVMGVSVRAADDLGSISPVQLRALTLLDALGQTNLATLATEMGVTVSTASRLVDRLVAAGRVVRRPSPASGRQVSLTLTAAGEALLREYDTRRVDVLRQHLDDVPAERREAVVDALREFAG